MTAFLTELGKQLAARWVAALVLPGTLFVAAATLGYVLGHANALDLASVRTWLDGVAAVPASGRSGTVLIAAGGFLVASAGAGTAAAALGLLVQWTWGLAGDAPVLSPLAGARRRRWEKAKTEADEAVTALLADTTDPALRARAREAIARRDGVCLVEPDRPTWIGDRLRAADVRVHRSYRLDLTAAWPRLWLVLPDAVRTELTAVQDRCSAAARLVGWGLLYLVLGILWWPALVVAAAALLASRGRCRRAVAVYADLAEASVDLYGRDLVRQLGLDCSERLTQAVGEAANAVLRKDETAY